MIFVCNTGPLIALAKLDRLALLQHLGGTSVFIPPMVYKELWGKIGPEAPLIPIATCLDFRVVSNVQEPLGFQDNEVTLSRFRHMSSSWL
jgi:predicted nucleic acid-binding protein